jgi:DNA-directed RNA polymerase subunit K/omega
VHKVIGNNNLFGYNLSFYFDKCFDLHKTSRIIINRIQECLDNDENLYGCHLVAGPRLFQDNPRNISIAIITGFQKNKPDKCLGKSIEEYLEKTVDFEIIVEYEGLQGISS